MDYKNLTVLITHYNRPNKLDRALDSVLKHMSGATILVYDDYSILNPIKKFYEEAHYFLGEENKGAQFSRNFLISKVRTTWSMILDCDDEIIKDGGGELDTSKVIYIPRASYKNQSFTFGTKPRSVLQFFRSNPIPHSGTIIKTQVLKLEKYDLNLKICQDLDLWVRLYLKYGIGAFEESNIQVLIDDDVDEFKISSKEKHLLGLIRILRIHRKKLIMRKPASYFIIKLYLKWLA